MEDIALFSGRFTERRVPSLGEQRLRNLTGIAVKNRKFAYANPIHKQTDLLYLSKGQLLDQAAPFSDPIRLASFNLNADTDALKFVPRSGLLPRVVDWESGQETFTPGSKEDEQRTNRSRGNLDPRTQQGVQNEGGDGEGQGGGDGGGVVGQVRLSF